MNFTCCQELVTWHLWFCWLAKKELLAELNTQEQIWLNSNHILSGNAVSAKQLLLGWMRMLTDCFFCSCYRPPCLRLTWTCDSLLNLFKSSTGTLCQTMRFLLNKQGENRRPNSTDVIMLKCVIQWIYLETCRSALIRSKDEKNCSSLSLMSTMSTKHCCKHTKSNY